MRLWPFWYLSGSTYGSLEGVEGCGAVLVGVRVRLIGSSFFGSSGFGVVNLRGSFGSFGASSGRTSLVGEVREERLGSVVAVWGALPVSDGFLTGSIVILASETFLVRSTLVSETFLGLLSVDGFLFGVTEISLVSETFLGVSEIFLGVVSVDGFLTGLTDVSLVSDTFLVVVSSDILASETFLVTVSTEVFLVGSTEGSLGSGTFRDVVSVGCFLVVSNGFLVVVVVVVVVRCEPGRLASLS